MYYFPTFSIKIKWSQNIHKQGLDVWNQIFTQGKLDRADNYIFLENVIHNTVIKNQFGPSRFIQGPDEVIKNSSNDKKN